MSNSRKYRNQFIVFFAWTILVVLFFKFIPEKRIAAVLAGSGFVFWPSLFIYFEAKKEQKNFLHIIIMTIFLLTNALPIFMLRILNWNTDFSTLSLFGISAQKFHGASNIMYLLMMVSCMFHSYRFRKLAELEMK